MRPSPADPPPKKLQFRGGTFGLFAPFGVLFLGILWLGISGKAFPEAFWSVTLLSLFSGLILTQDRNHFVEAMLSGVASRLTAIMLLAWLLGGIFGRLLNASGLVEGLVWLAGLLTVSANWFPLIVFAAASLLSISTGSSIGTLLTVTPILFPAGFALGADPWHLVGALIGGAYVGDNLAPVSDTTIVSAYTQGTEVKKVVRSRVRYAVLAGTCTVLIYATIALLDDRATASPEGIGAEPRGLLMLLAPAILIVLMLRGTHLIAALFFCNFGGILLALTVGLLSPEEIVAIDAEQFQVRGVIAEGIAAIIGIGVFGILLMGLVGVLQAGGFIETVLTWADRFAHNARRAELAIVASTLTVNGLTTAGTPAMIILGPFVRQLGHRFKLAPWRRGNLLDGCSTSIIGFIPYSPSLLIPYALVANQVAEAGISGFDPVSLVPYPFYCWSLMFVMVFAALTGWGSETMTEAEWEKERKELESANGEVRSAN